MTTTAAYLAGNRQLYLNMARDVVPDLRDERAVWARVAFAILSAHAHFDMARAALDYCVENRDDIREEGLRPYTMVPAKAYYVSAIGNALEHVRRDGETYHEHRLRLWKTVPGLGLVKASFAVALLDPLHADVACLDTHLQRVYLGTTAFKRLPLATYLCVEAKVRRVARRHEVSTFVAQWAIWDHARGGVTSHDIFPK